MIVPYVATVLGALSVMVPLVSIAYELNQNHPHDQIYSNFIDYYKIPMHSIHDMYRLDVDIIHSLATNLIEYVGDHIS